MGIFSSFRKKQLFTHAEEQQIVDAIKAAEKKTSGEIRVYIESHCKFVEPLDRAREVFFGLKMDQTDDHNAVLVYVAIKDRQLAVFGDEGIHQRTGLVFWNEKVKKMLLHFNQQHFSTGIAQMVTDIGEALYRHFPYNGDTDKNELPDDIVFGK